MKLYWSPSLPSIGAVAAALTIAAYPLQAAASPINPWGVEVGEGVFALTPFLFVDQGVGLYPYLYGQYGVTDRFELLGGVGATVLPGVSLDSAELMPRLFFSDTTAVALHLKYVAGSNAVSAAPEWHGVYPAGPLTLSINAGWAPSFGAGGFAAGSAYAYVAPEYYFTEATSIFLEIDPSVDLNDYGVSTPDRFALSVLPGVSTCIGERHYFAVGVSVPVTGFDPTAIYAGAWYSIAFGGA